MTDDDYDAAADMSGSIAECYRAIRERVAKGGPPWWLSDFKLTPEILQKLADAERRRQHANRFRRAADRHDNRIPFETRLAVLERADERCEHCGRFIASDFAACLELHHITYERAYGDELPEDLRALCRDCHAAEHGLG